MIELKEKPTLADLQNHIKQIGIERAWNKNNYLEIFLLFSEEIGELAKAIRNYAGLYVEKNKAENFIHMEEEFADVLNYLLDLANYFNIDLETAFRNKDKVNSQRTWISK